MNRKLLSFFAIIILGGAANAQNSSPESSINLNGLSFMEKNRWDKNWLDVRIWDFPQIGLFYNFDNRDDLLFRIAMPTTFPILLITPSTATYASSYWGMSGLLMDITLGFNVSELKLSDSILLRFFPISVWGGIPLSSKGMGIYMIFETVPLSIFNNSGDNYSTTYYGIGINAGIKYIISGKIELELKYENYFSYNDFGIWNKYIGLTFKYRLFGPGYYGIW